MRRQCASCHNHAVSSAAFRRNTGAEPPEGGTTSADILAEKPTAANLTGYASRRWLAGLLDPKQIKGPEYFGNTKFRGGKMASFVKENLGDLDADEKKNLEKVIAAVSAEAKLPAQHERDRADARLIAEGRSLVLSAEAPFTCTDCHAFRGKGRPGDAPLLTGYGSPGWIAGIIGNPAGKLYYGKLNDRMPAYAPSADAAQNTLGGRQIKMLTDWLRGDWYEQRRNER